jgi:hypothetical protein
MAALAAREEPRITVGERWQHHSTGVYVVKRFYADQGRWRVTIREEETDKLSEVWADYFRENFTLAAAREEPQGDEFDTRGLREAIGVINAAVAVWRLDSPDEPIPVWAATNAVIQQISFVEGKSIKDVVAELQIDEQREAER